ncbi:hypothetical protein F5051DRAFT_505048 [Lentinula edodes]|nr:hypothetical protein F5051DRAFT_505048 [Lentinula edodes]
MYLSDLVYPTIADYQIPYSNVFLNLRKVLSLLTSLKKLPAVFILYNSPFWSGAFLIAIFSVSVWNGGGFYIEVFGRKFERELEALRKELAEIAQVKPGLNGPSFKLDSFPDEDTMSSRSSSQDFRFPPQPVPSNMTLEGEMPKATET